MSLPVGTCYWCSCTMFSAKDVGSMAPNCRTLDHIKCKAECRDRGEYVNQKNKVWACYACNQERNRLFMLANPEQDRPSWAIESRRRFKALAEHRRNLQAAKAASKSFLPERTGHTYY